MPDSNHSGAPEPTPAVERPLDARARRRQRLVRATSFLIPPLFACAAALVHFEFHVPRSPMVPRAKEDKKKGKPPKSTKRQAWKPREQAKLDELRARWEKEALADEPEDADFRRQHDSLLRAVVQVAREDALDNQRSVSLRVTPHCKTIRCSLDLCGPTSAVEAIAALLPTIERHDGPLWHELREVQAEDEEPKPNAPKDAPEAEPRICKAWVVGFRVDGTKRNELKIAGREDEPAKARDSTAPREQPEPG
ncbi:hypothetical protein ACNOYE_09165 [Nannocystaceae bacterium ST9]